MKIEIELPVEYEEEVEEAAKHVGVSVPTLTKMALMTFIHEKIYRPSGGSA